jgi:hypothetical protein
VDFAVDCEWLGRVEAVFSPRRIAVFAPDRVSEARRFADHYLVNVIVNPLDSTVAVHHLIFGACCTRIPS